MNDAGIALQAFLDCDQNDINKCSALAMAYIAAHAAEIREKLLAPRKEVEK